MTGKKTAAILNLDMSNLICREQELVEILDFLLSELKKFKIEDVFAVEASDSLKPHLKAKGVKLCSGEIEDKKFAAFGTIAYFPKGNLWVDRHFKKMVEEFEKSGSKFYCNVAQAGYTPVLSRNDLETIRIVHASVSPIGAVNHTNNKGAEGTVSKSTFSRKLTYLGLDERDGLDAVLAYMSGSAARIAETKNVFHVMNRRHLDIQLKRIATFTNLNNIRVLEIGASTTNPMLSQMLVEDYGCEYVGLNIQEFKYEPLNEKVELIEQDIHKFRPKGKFDLVFSIAVWEHIPNPLPLFKTIPTWLKIGGLHYGSFQAWSSRVGHHIFAPRFPAHLVPDWVHLYSNEKELPGLLVSKGATKKQADDITDFMFKGREINRVRLKDFLEAIRECGLETMYLDSRVRGNLSSTAPEIEGYSAAELSSLGLEFALRKSQFHMADMTPVKRTKTSGDAKYGIEELETTLVKQLAVIGDDLKRRISQLEEAGLSSDEKISGLGDDLKKQISQLKQANTSSNKNLTRVGDNLRKQISQLEQANTSLDKKLNGLRAGLGAQISEVKQANTSLDKHINGIHDSLGNQILQLKSANTSTSRKLASVLKQKLSSREKEGAAVPRLKGPNTD